MARNRKRSAFDDLAERVEARTGGRMARDSGPAPSRAAYQPLLPLDDAAVQKGSAGGSAFSHRQLADLYQREVNKHMADSQGGVTPGLSEFIASAGTMRRSTGDGNVTH
jgi:hypothetical protein